MTAEITLELQRKNEQIAAMEREFTNQIQQLQQNMEAKDSDLVLKVGHEPHAKVSDFMTHYDAL